ncbi:Kinase-like protein [Mycena sanguinolenta]|uniref:Kinase-like protein n=1 Tax=Mycena sanguinolenta TaxID=230812 RepID=A0A8H6Y2T4_9AGAR|nr:Kinase-like protein [Mycena sanguinolenta]
MLPALSPFTPQDGEDFVWRHVEKTIRTPAGMWRQLTPATNLALDPHTREVMIKAVPPPSHSRYPSNSEAQILAHLSSPELRQHPENHTIPVMSIIECERATFLVQARWGGWWFGDAPCSIRFWAGVQAVQLLEGLAFMHERGIIHGDIYTCNIVCNFNARRTRPAPCRVFEEFKKSGNYRVAFIDFGQAMQFDLDSSSNGLGSSFSHGFNDRSDAHLQMRLPHTDIRAAPPHPRIEMPTPRPIRGPPDEFRAPEIDNCTTYDPFAADVFSVARLLLDLDPPLEIPAEYQALLEDMTNVDPRARPSARRTLERLQAISKIRSADWV